MRRRRPPTGAPPGVLATHPDATPARLSAFVWGPGELPREVQLDSPADLAALTAAPEQQLWLDLQGLDDAASLGRVAELFAIHPLALADAVNTPHRAKAEIFADRSVVITHMARVENGEVSIEQLAIIVGPRFVVTLQDREHGDVLDPVRAQLRNSAGRLTSATSDQLALAIIDTVVDGYFPTVEHVAENLEALELEIMTNPSPESLHRLQKIKRVLLHLRRNLWGQRETLSTLMRSDHPHLGAAIHLHLRDVYDHVIQLIDVLETHREIASSLVDAYLSSLSNRLNEVMKVLTVISTIFMPLSFLAGVYGMNFKHMPELEWWWAYPFVLVVMLGAGLGMLQYFRRRGWVEAPGSARKKRRALDPRATASTRTALR